MDGEKEKFDAIILATGYKSNVPSWLKVLNYLLIYYTLVPSLFLILRIQLVIMHGFTIKFKGLLKKERYVVSYMALTNCAFVPRRGKCFRRKMDCLDDHFQTVGKVRVGYTRWGSPNVASSEPPWMLGKLQRILNGVGKQRLRIS